MSISLKLIKLPQLALLEFIVVLYWFLFWALNGADKFLNGTDMTFFMWFGKDRDAQLGNYFATLNISDVYIEPILYVVGCWEIALSLTFLATAIFIVAGVKKRNLWKVSQYGFFLTALTFMGFSIFDIVVGDRFELLEHTVYVVMAIASWFIFAYSRDLLDKAIPFVQK